MRSEHLDGDLSDKVDQIIALLNSSGKDFQAPRLPHQSVGAKRLSPADFVRAMLHRAPNDFLERSDADTLANCAVEAAHELELFLAEEHAFRITLYTPTGGPHTPTGNTESPMGAPRSANPRAEFTCLLAVSWDRAFLVDTLTETLKALDITHYVVLHPIFNYDVSRRISIMYVEIERIEDPQQLHQVHQTLTGAFSELEVVTDDFAAMLEQSAQVTELVESADGITDFAKGLRDETAELLRWLAAGGFVFLGAKEWISVPEASTADFSQRVSPVDGSAYGLFRSTTPAIVSVLSGVQADAGYTLEKRAFVNVTKVLHRSPVHHPHLMDLVCIKIPAPDGERMRVFTFLGQLTSKARAEEASSTPLIREKLQRILEQEEFIPNSYDYKEVIAIADRLPKAELLQHTMEQLRSDLLVVVGLQRRDQIRVRCRYEPLKRFASLLIAVPEGRYAALTAEDVSRHVEQLLCAHPGTAEYRVTLADYPIVILHLIVPMAEPGIALPDDESIERSLEEFTAPWLDRITQSLAAAQPLATSSLTATTDSVLDESYRLARLYASTFPEHYRSTTSVAQVAADIRMLENTSEQADVDLSLQELASEKGEKTYELRLYSRGTKFTLTALLPYLENCGLIILDEQLTELPFSPRPRYIYSFRVRPKTGKDLDLKAALQYALPGLVRVFRGELDNDELNALLLSAGVNYREVALLRTVSHYMWQLKLAPTLGAINQAFVNCPEISKSLVNYFALKFDPSKGIAIDARRDLLLVEEKTYLQTLKLLGDPKYDRILKAALNVLHAAVRTNFYAIAPDDTRIAIKLLCKDITLMPVPRPMFEVFVVAPDFEGVHLRGGKVARGGLRHSDRHDDYRTEVHGLMKTQMLKNTIIVPVGAKGGFVLKNTFKTHQETLIEVERVYRRFIRSMLEIADNRVGEKIERHPAVLAYDEADPYFVVAADKGTATFSDVANSIAVDDFNFWLGDAFASGGSNGYDHKRLAITSRGAWETARRHFRELGVDLDMTEVTAIGIGDMSGDVFGNGLLRSPHIKLLAAFNHQHIFIDPSPDPTSSFEERSRLFHMHRSSWNDYNRERISTGGGIYERSAKEIELSPAALKALGLQSVNASTVVLSVDELIQAILRAPVDLFWNGGIGTYVKASAEDNVRVGDRTNDDVRVNACDVRAKVVSEGGNLGFTQLARIEYERSGGKINTDAVDNSGGVNMSDLEVNTKILLAGPMLRGECTIEQRNEILHSLSDDMCERVIERNRFQSQGISIAHRRGYKNVAYYRGLIRKLESDGLLNREAEFLPADEVIQRMSTERRGFTRPELSTLLSYSRMSLFNGLMQSALLDDPFLEQIVFDYFPKKVTDRFPAAVRTHALRRGIIGTEVASTVTARMGASFVYRVAEENGRRETDVLFIFIAVDAISRGKDVESMLRTLDTPTCSALHLSALQQLGRALEDMTNWFLERRLRESTLTELVKRYVEPFEQLQSISPEFIIQDEKAIFERRVAEYSNAGLPTNLVQRLGLLPYNTIFLDLIEISHNAHAPLPLLARLYSHLAVELRLTQVLRQASQLEPSNRWESAAQRSVLSQVRRNTALVLQHYVTISGTPSETGLKAYLADRKDLLDRYHMTFDDVASRPPSLAGLLVLANRLISLMRAHDTSAHD